MSTLEWIGFGIVLYLAVAAIIGVSACCLSSRISRNEEKRSGSGQVKIENAEIRELVERETWILDEDNQPRLVKRPKEYPDEDNEV